jgi:death-on-curing protein
LSEPIWLSRQVVELIHFEQLAEHGGRRGLRDEDALESALARPQHLWSYRAEASIADLAASLCFGIVRGHPFVDGNKRTGFLSAYVFLRLNGLEVEAPDEEIVDSIEGVASGAVSESDLAARLDRWSRISGS